MRGAVRKKYAVVMCRREMARIIVKGERMAMVEGRQEMLYNSQQQQHCYILRKLSEFHLRKAEAWTMVALLTSLLLPPTPSLH